MIYTFKNSNKTKTLFPKFVNRDYHFLRVALKTSLFFQLTEALTGYAGSATLGIGLEVAKFSEARGRNIDHFVFLVWSPAREKQHLAGNTRPVVSSR